MPSKIEPRSDEPAHLISETVGPVMLLTINRERSANALSPDCLALLNSALDQAESDSAIRCIVLTGAGERHFCAGADLKAMASADREKAAAGAREWVGMRLRKGKPILAAVNGVAVGGGFELALSCDMIIAAPHARFGLPEVKRGLVAGGGGTRLPRRIPMAIALQMGLTGEMITAARAFELGLVNIVSATADPRPDALELARSIAANAPLAVRATKQLMYEEDGEWNAAHIADVSRPVFGSDDAREGTRAFVERRPPVFQGR